jgi:hypothetical protein
MSENHTKPTAGIVDLPTDVAGLIKLNLIQMRAAGAWHEPTITRIIENLDTITTPHQFTPTVEGGDNCRICGKWYYEHPEPPAREPKRHTDRSVPCPTCGFVVRKVERAPFIIETDEPEPPAGETDEPVAHKKSAGNCEYNRAVDAAHPQSPKSPDRDALSGEGEG